MNRTIGVAMIIIGAIMLIWTGFTYTDKEKLIDAGPIQVSAEKKRKSKLAPLFRRYFTCWRHCYNCKCKKRVSNYLVFAGSSINKTFSTWQHLRFWH